MVEATEVSQLVGVWSLGPSVDAVFSSVHGMVHPEKPSHLGLPPTTLTRTTWRAR